jgi:hypothetical protein
MALAWLQCPSCDSPVHQNQPVCPRCQKMMPTDREIFVFGSNLGGIHGRGSAFHARKYYGALQGVGQGRMGHAYAIPTKDKRLRTLSVADIAGYVKTFLDYARQNTDLTFNVVAIGCGLAGYTPDDIAPLFQQAPSNVKLPLEFNTVLADSRQTGLFKVIPE